MNRKKNLAIVRGAWKQPPSQMPFGSTQAAHLILRGIVNSGLYKHIDLYEDENLGQEFLRGNVTYRNYDVSSLSQSKQNYHAIYVSVDPMRRVSHALRQINDYAPIISDVGTSHFDLQWQNYFIARTSHLIRPTDGIIFKSGRTQSLFKLMWSEWNKIYEFMPFPESTIIANGIDTVANQRDLLLRKETREFLGLKQTDIVFLAFSRLAPSTKIDYEALVVIWKKIVDENPNAILLLAGSIVTYPDHLDFPQRLSALSRDLGIANNVIVFGNPYDVFADAKTSLMSAADVFVHTTKGVEETSSLVILEAMAHELPVLVSDWSGFSEIVKHGINGFVIDTYSSNVLPVLKQMFSSELSSNYNGKLESHVFVSPDQIIKSISFLIKNKQKRIIMGKKSKQDVSDNFSITYLVKHRLDFFDNVSRNARQEWSKLKEFYSKPSPLVNVDLVINQLASKTIKPSTQFQISDVNMIKFIPEMEDKNFSKISQLIISILKKERMLSAAQIAKIIYKVDTSQFDLENIWPYFSLVLIRLLSFKVIDIG